MKGPRLRSRRPRGQAVLAAELARLRRVERVALEFCARCERGEIRSSTTYEQFRTALARPGRERAAICHDGRTVGA